MSIMSCTKYWLAFSFLLSSFLARPSTGFWSNWTDQVLFLLLSNRQSDGIYLYHVCGILLKYLELLSLMNFILHITGSAGSIHRDCWLDLPCCASFFLTIVAAVDVYNHVVKLYTFKKWFRHQRGERNITMTSIYFIRSMYNVYLILSAYVRVYVRLYSTHWAYFIYRSSRRSRPTSSYSLYNLAITVREIRK